MNSVPHSLLIHLRSADFAEKKAMEKASLATLGRLAYKGLSSPLGKSILRSGPVRAVENAAVKGLGRVADHVLKHPKVYAPLMRNSGKILATGGATAAAGYGTKPLWSPSLQDSMQRIMQQFRGGTPEVKAACALQSHLLTPTMQEKRAFAAAWNTAKGVAPAAGRALLKIPAIAKGWKSWQAGANAAKANGAAGHFARAARKMPKHTPEYAATMQASQAMRGAGANPGGFFGSLRYGMGKMNPGNSFRLTNGGPAGAAWNAALPVATGATGLGLGYVNGAERGVADTMSEFEQMPWYKLMAFGAPNVFGHRQWAMDNALKKKEEEAGFFGRLFGPDYGDIRNRMDSNRQRFADERSEKWDQWMNNVKNVFAS